MLFCMPEYLTIAIGARVVCVSSAAHYTISVSENSTYFILSS